MFLAFKLSNLITVPFGWRLGQLYQLFENYGIAMIVFGILVQLIMLPIKAKSKKSMMKMSRVQPLIQDIQKRYAGDTQKQNEMLQKLYQEEGISMGGGCLPMIVRLIIMMGVYYAVVSPFTYVVGVDKGALTAASNWASYVRVAEDYGDDDISVDDW